VQLGHIVEVHAVDAGDDGQRHEDDGDDGQRHEDDGDDGQDAHLLVHAVGLEGKRYMSIMLNTMIQGNKGLEWNVSLRRLKRLTISTDST